MKHLCNACDKEFQGPFPVCFPADKKIRVKLNGKYVIKCNLYKKKKKKSWLEQLIQNFVSTRYFNKNNKQKSYVKQHSYLYCLIMNIVDIRFWFCKCRYFDPYGKVIYAGCKRHD